jgi:hypothetical protein
MPRQSSEARAAAVWRADLEPPRAPAHLTAAAKRLWREIVEDRPADYFRPGSFDTLATFCTVTLTLRHMWKVERASRGEPAAHTRILRRICALAALQARLCGDLRMTPRANIERHSAKRDAKGLPLSPLLGGKAAWGEH